MYRGTQTNYFKLMHLLKGMDCYVGQLLDPAESFGQGLLALRAKKRALYARLVHLSPFLQGVMSDAGYFERQ